MMQDYLDRYYLPGAAAYRRADGAAQAGSPPTEWRPTLNYGVHNSMSIGVRLRSWTTR